MNKNMKIKNPNTGDQEKHGHSHARHLWMMGVFCGIPIIVFLALGVYGFNMPSVEIFFLTVCAMFMISMMVIMNRSSDGKVKVHATSQSRKGADYETGK